MGTPEPVIKPLKLSDVRSRIGEVFSEAVFRHRPIPIARGARDVGMLLGLEEIGRLVEGLAFQPEVFKEAEGVSIWLPEFQVYGRGKDFGSARADLLEEVREYVHEYLQEIDSYRAAPNRRAHFSHVIKALMADLSGDLDSVVFAEPSGSQAPQASATTDLR